NTDKSVKQWMALFIKFRNLHGYSQEIIELDNNTLSDQLKQFLVEVRKSNGQEYKASSLYTGFSAIAQGISETFKEVRVVNIFDKHQFRSLHRTLDGRMKSIVEKGNKNRKQSDPLETEEIKFLLDSPVTTINTPKGGDAKRLKASWIKELDNGGMQLELPKEKNHAGGVKDPYAEAGISFIPPDSLGNAYTPVADIKRYLLRRPNNVEDDYFFVSINVPKKVYRGEWYLPTKLGKCSHDAMMHSICEEAKLDFKGRNITNHSMRSTGIHSLVESGVTLDEQMLFSRHKTIAGVSAYQHQSMKRKIDNVSRLIPTEETASDLLSTTLNKKTKTSEDRELDDQKP
ncbi:11218_t:CDS:2, partial [Racocetra fulgida]